VTQDEFENLLRAWGYAFGPRSAELRQEERSPTGDSPLARIGQTRTIRQVTTMDRGGHARRRTMGAAANLIDKRGDVRLAPAWASDPIRATETRTATAKLLAVNDPQFSPEIMRVEAAALRLNRADGTLGQVLRVEYCQLGSQADKAEKFGLRRNAYRERVAEARGWVRRDLAA